MTIEERIRGLVRAEISCPEPEELLNACLTEDLPILQPRRQDLWTLRLCVYERDYPRLAALVLKRGGELRLLSQRGGSRDRRLLRRRLGLLIGGAALLACLLVSSLFVWEIRLEGAEDLSRGELLRKLEDCGLRTGSFTPAVDVEALCDRMLLSEPRLVWMTVNFRGSVAEVRLLRRVERTEIRAETAPADLRASRTGIIRRVSVLSGQPAVQPGEAVTVGELLISGTVDSITAAPRSLRAQGEVWADTWYEMTALCPASQGKARAGGGPRGRLALKIGDTRINFYQNSGKPIDGCDKIVHEYILGIGGLFQLPLGLVWEEIRPYAAAGTAAGIGEEAGQRMIAELAERIDGEILTAQILHAELDGLTAVTVRAHCLENIAQQVDITQ